MSKGKKLNTERMRLRVDNLRIHPIAQRRVVPATLKKILGRLNLDAIGTIHVVRYAIDGEAAYWVVDGQHRVAALVKEGFGEWQVDVCYHSEVKDHAGAARLFLDLNTRASTHPFDKFVNEVEAGEEAAVAVSNIVKDHGFRVERFNSDGTIACVNTLKAIYARGGAHALNSTLGIASTAWGHTSAAVEGKVLEGLGLVCSHYNGELDKGAMAKKLAKYPGGATALLGAAKGMKQHRPASLARCVGEIVVEMYNKGRRAEKLEGF